VFDLGGYRPVAVHGESAAHVIAFARWHAGEAIIVVVGRLFSAVTDGGRRWPRARDWEAELALEDFQDVRPVVPAPASDSGPRIADNGRVSLKSLFETVPVALLHARSKRPPGS
jgi:(1->4)-alpha-D-glucan 1-alpha-D-glucosylmutase